MSTTAQFVNEEHFLESMTAVRNDSNEVNYMIVGHVKGDPLKIEVVGTGDDPDELCSKFNDGEVQYGLARYTSKFDMSTTVKFVYFRWVGDKVPFAKRGRYGVVQGSIQDRFNPFHLFIDSSSIDDFETENVLQQLEENTGKCSRVLDSMEGRQERGFTATQLPKRGPQVKTGPQVAQMGSAVEISPEVVEAVAMVRRDEDPVQWMLAEYKDNNPRGPIIQTLSGQGDSNELTANFMENKPMYALYRVSDVIDDIVTVKFVFIAWVGSEVKPMIKAKISTHNGVVQQTFGPYHVKIFASDRLDVTEHLIREKVASASGTKSNVK